MNFEPGGSREGPFPGGGGGGAPPGAIVAILAIFLNGSIAIGDGKYIVFWDVDEDGGRGSGNLELTCSFATHRR